MKHIEELATQLKVLNAEHINNKNQALILKKKRDKKLDKLNKIVESEIKKLVGNG